MKLCPFCTLEPILEIEAEAIKSSLGFKIRKFAGAKKCFRHKTGPEDWVVITTNQGQ